jgi:hypothetical protein
MPLDGELVRYARYLEREGRPSLESLLNGDLVRYAICLKRQGRPSLESLFILDNEFGRHTEAGIPLLLLVNVLKRNNELAAWLKVNRNQLPSPVQFSLFEHWAVKRLPEVPIAKASLTSSGDAARIVGRRKQDFAAQHPTQTPARTETISSDLARFMRGRRRFPQP